MDLAILRNLLKEALPEPVALLGYGVEGESTLQLLLDCGFEQIEILDREERRLPEGVRGKWGEGYLFDLNRFSTIIRSAGVRPLLPELRDFVDQGGLLTSQVQIFFDLFDGEVVGITGTMGKGTTTMLLSSCLERAAIPHVVGGNIGTPVLDLLRSPENPSLALLELSSFQLLGLRCSPRIAVVLRTTVEHLDWHPDVEEYRQAKSFLVRGQSPQQLCVFCGDAQGSIQIASYSAGRKVAVGRSANSLYLIEGESLLLSDGPLFLSECAVWGEFMLENMAAAAAAAVELGVPAEQLRAALQEFKGLRFRLEFVGEGEGIRYFNDSYATRPDAALAAAQSFEGPLAMILGGSEKFADFTELLDGLAVHRTLVHCALIGKTAERIEEGLNARSVSCMRYSDLPSAFAACQKKLLNGGTLLFSPACASFGLFRNYKERGAAFDHLVAESLQR